MTPHDTEDGSQAKTSPREFGREEWVKNLRLRLGIHPATVIGLKRGLPSDG